jgi:hypothetical protein
MTQTQLRQLVRRRQLRRWERRRPAGFGVSIGG